MKASRIPFTSSRVISRAFHSSSSEGANGCPPINDSGLRMPAWWIWTRDTLPWRLMPSAIRVRPSKWSSVQQPICPGNPLPTACTCEAQVIVAPWPPSARFVSHRYSSSLILPSSWLWLFVKGASMKRFFMGRPPERKVMGSKIFFASSRALSETTVSANFGIFPELSGESSGLDVDWELFANRQVGSVSEFDTETGSRAAAVWKFGIRTK
mmetsp:Transcript_5132/g.12244  ORF Transcript_5132/g.12244 Transcript_5132/m.12244 type:complete len:211 (+) Transcript_5132:1298-1930(+)